MKSSTLTGNDNYFEDFHKGDLFKHARGKTVTEMDNVLITNMVMNTAEGHFNEHAMATSAGDIFAKRRVVFGGINLSFVIGLAGQDTAEHALSELTLDRIKLSHPVFHGDTLYAYSEVLSTEDSDREDAGIVCFRHYGLNQDDKLCVEVDRRVLLKRRSHWAAK